LSTLAAAIQLVNDLETTSALLVRLLMVKVTIHELPLCRWAKRRNFQRSEISVRTISR
jgi:hypothetical protein